MRQKERKKEEARKLEKWPPGDPGDGGLLIAILTSGVLLILINMSCLA